MRRPSPALLIALLALVLAMSGAAYAVITAPKNSVVSRSIKNGQVKRVDIRQGAVNGAKLADGSVGGRDLAPGSVAGRHIADGSVGPADLSPAVGAPGQWVSVAPNPAAATDPCDSGATATFCGYHDSGVNHDYFWRNDGNGHGDVAFRHEGSDLVRLAGVATAEPWQVQTPSRVFILPPAYRPSVGLELVGSCLGTSASPAHACPISVMPDGSVNFAESGSSFDGAYYFLALDGITFPLR